jgi:hypothetical protein
MRKRITPEPTPAAEIVRFKNPYRIAEWGERTRTSKATTWRRIKDGTLTLEYYGSVPFIVAGPAAFADQVA